MPMLVQTRTGRAQDADQAGNLCIFWNGWDSQSEPGFEKDFCFEIDFQRSL